MTVKEQVSWSAGMIKLGIRLRDVPVDVRGTKVTSIPFQNKMFHPHFIRGKLLAYTSKTFLVES